MSGFLRYQKAPRYKDTRLPKIPSCQDASEHQDARVQGCCLRCLDKDNIDARLPKIPRVQDTKTPGGLRYEAAEMPENTKMPEPKIPR